jgi:hypothetical protein
MALGGRLPIDGDLNSAKFGVILAMEERLRLRQLLG